MKIGSMIAIYFVIWWTVLFAVLPFGIRNAHEAGEKVELGNDAGAPVTLHLGKKVLITGGSRGIGASLVKIFCDHNAQVIYTGKSKVSSQPIKNAKYLSLDLSDDQSISSFLKEIENENIDILVNNAGINKIDPFEDISTEDFRLIQKVNLEGPFVLCRHLVPKMAKKNHGRVINIASIFSGR